MIMTKKKPPELHGKRGRPSLKTPEMMDRIIEALASTKSLEAIAQENGLPSAATIIRWRTEDPVFNARYVEAQEIRVDAFVEQTLDIADDASNDWIEKETKDGRPYVALNTEHIMRAKLRIEQRRWYAEKLRPKKYGTKVAIGGDEDAPPIKVTNTFDVSGLSLEELDVLERAITKATGQ